MWILQDVIELRILLPREDDEPESTAFIRAEEDVVPLVCTFFEAKLAERGYPRLRVVWPDQGKSLVREENPIE